MSQLQPGEILQRIRATDRQFVVEMQAIIRQIAQRWHWTSEQYWEDIAQDCFLKLLRNLERGEFRGQSSLKTYVYAIVRNTCLDYYRTERMTEMCDIDKVPLIDPAISPEQRLISSEERLIACKVLLSLPRECRRLWRAVFFGKRTYRQAAEALGLTEGTVKRKMWECRQLARQMVEELDNREPRVLSKD